jgi:hypothetical protein
LAGNTEQQQRITKKKSKEVKKQEIEIKESKQEVDNKCAVCNKKSTNRCSRCQCRFYCSLEHQKEDWKQHKINCKKQ